jgi:hypothetical protein
LPTDGIDGNNAAFDLQELEKFRDGRNLIGLFSHFALSENQVIGIGPDPRQYSPALP